MKKILLAALMAVTIPCASQVNVQGSNIQIGGNIMGATVPPTPQGSIFVQPNSGTVSAIGAAPTSLNATSPLIQGKGNTDLFSTSNNGIALFFTSYPTGYAQVPPNSTSTEAWSKPPAGAIYEDYRNNISARVHHDVVSPDTDQCSDVFGIGNFSRCDKGFFDLMKGTYVFGAQSCEPSGPGWNLGDTEGLPYAGGWSIRQCQYIHANLLTQGIKQAATWWVDAYGGGDVGGHYIYLTGPGGSWDAAAEGLVSGYFNVSERNPYYHGTVTTGSTGATTLTINRTSGAKYPTQGGYFLDISKPAYTATSTGHTFTPLVSGGYNFLSVTYPGGAFPVSAWGISQAGTNASANGQYQINVQQTIAFTIGSSTNLAVGDHVCLLGAENATFSEETTISAVTGSGGVGGTQTVTFTTRKAYGPHFAMMQGPMCGTYLTVTGASNRTAVMVIGATSATNLIIAACTHGSCTSNADRLASSGLYVNTIESVGLNHTFYPGAEITGQGNGSLTAVNLGKNTVPWAASDVVESPNPPSVNITALHALCDQTTPENAYFSICLDVDYTGTAAINQISRIKVGPTTTGVGSLLNLDMTDNTHVPASYIQVGGKAPLVGIINGQGLQSGVDIPVIHGPSGLDPVLYIKSTGEWLATKQNAWTLVLAANTPPNPDDTDEIPVSVGTVNPSTASNWHNYKVSGDCTMHLGAFTCAGSGGTMRYVGTKTSSGGSTDNLTVTGLTTSNHCNAQQTGETSPNPFTVEVSANTVSLLFPTGVASNTYDIFCDAGAP